MKQIRYKLFRTLRAILVLFLGSFTLLLSGCYAPGGVGEPPASDDELTPVSYMLEKFEEQNK